MSKSVRMIFFIIICCVFFSVAVSALDTPWLPLKPDGGNTETSSPVEEGDETETETETNTETDSYEETDTEAKGDDEALKNNISEDTETAPVDISDGENGPWTYVIIGGAVVVLLCVGIIVLKKGRKAT